MPPAPARPALAVLLVACSGTPSADTPSATPGSTAELPSSSSTRAGEMRVVPQLVVGLAFPGSESAPHATATQAEAEALRDTINDEAKAQDRAEGSRGWFFRGFDQRTLYFFVAHFHVRCAQLGCQEYVVDRIYEIERTPDAARALEVDRTLELYDRGFHGVRGGMTRDQVKGVLGAPESTEVLQYVGSYRWRYPGLSVLFWNDVVADVQSGP